MGEFSELINANKVNIFISYSWDDEEHKSWVSSLTETLEENGFNVILDRNSTRFGDDIQNFMERAIFTVDVILIILTPAYKQKADNRTHNAGYEYGIISKRLYESEISVENKIVKQHYIPILRSGTNDSIPLYLKSTKYVDLREQESYSSQMDQLINQLKTIPVKKQKTTETIRIMVLAYKSTEDIVEALKSSFSNYFNKVFFPNGKHLLNTQRLNSIKIKVLLREWEKEIKNYQNEFDILFSKEMMDYYAENVNEFKTHIVGKKLWTIRSALMNHDPDLAGYRKHFKRAEANDVLTVISKIINHASQYANRIHNNINYENIEKPEKLSLGLLNNNETVLPGVIGPSIRSELMHRLYPKCFPIMSQKSLWAFYFLTKNPERGVDNKEEFILLEENKTDRRIRLSHNWRYDYERFSFYNNIIAKLLKEQILSLGFDFDNSLRFGLVNMFLRTVADLHKEDKKLLHEWS